MNDACVRDVTAPEGPDAGRPVPVYLLPQIWAGAFFFGPLCAAWLVSRNFKACGQAGNAFRAVLTGIFALIGVSYALAFMTQGTQVFLLMVAVAFSAALLARFAQKGQVEACLALGFPPARGERVALAGVLCLLPSAVLCLFTWLATEAAFPGSMPVVERMLD